MLFAGIPSPPIEWNSFSIGPLTIHWYAIIIVIGIVVATIWTNARLTKRGGEPWVVIDIALWAVVLGLLGARLYHVFTHPADYFYEGANLWAVFFIWEGGNAIIGALIGGAVGVAIACRNTGIRFWSFADALAPGLLTAQAIGRLGNYVNNELFGQPTDLPWGLQIDPSMPTIPAGLPEGTLFHPTFLYEMLWNLVGVALILILERMFRMRWGKTIAVYFIWYGLGRMWIEALRVDYSEIILGMRSNILGALVLVIVGVALFIVQLRRHPEPELSVYQPGRSPAEVAAAAEQDALEAEEQQTEKQQAGEPSTDEEQASAEQADEEQASAEQDSGAESTEGHAPSANDRQ